MNSKFCTGSLHVCHGLEHCLFGGMHLLGQLLLVRSNVALPVQEKRRECGLEASIVSKRQEELDTGVQIDKNSKHAAAPCRHLVFVNDPHFFCDLVNQTKVVRNENDSAREVVEGVRERVDRLHVEICTMIQTERTRPYTPTSKQ